MITSQWYKRQEQPLRVATWYGTNGLATMLGSLMSFAIGYVKSPVISRSQLVFILPACLTILTAPIIVWVVPSTIDDAKWLNEHDRAVAYERVRFNQTSTGSTKFKVPQLLEALWDPKTWVMVCTSVLLNAGANVTGTFGGLLVKGLGFDNFKTSLLNMPFGAVQVGPRSDGKQTGQTLIGCSVFPVARNRLVGLGRHSIQIQGYPTRRHLCSRARRMYYLGHQRASEE